MSKEAMKLALEALEALEGLEALLSSTGLTHLIVYGDAEKAITDLRKALAEQPAQQDGTCSNALRIQGKAYPRTCKKCGLGPCVELAQQALDKKAENARELGLDYGPAQQEPVAWMFQHGETGRTLCVDAQQVKWGFEERNPSYQKIAPLYTSPPAQRTWVGLTQEERDHIWDTVGNSDAHGDVDGWSGRDVMSAIEAKLKEKNNG